MTDTARWVVVFAAVAVAIVALVPHNGMTAGVRVIAVFVAAAIAMFMAVPLQAHRRARAMQAAAGQIGFTFEGDEWSDPDQRPKLGTTLFQMRNGRYGNVMTGTAEGFKTSFFDYGFFHLRYKAKQTVAAFSQERWIPLFELRPDNHSDPVMDPQFTGHIDFDFAERYVLRGPEEDEIREMFNPTLTSALTSYTPERGWHIEGMGTTLILYRFGVLVRPNELPAFLTQTSLIARTFFDLCGLKKPVT